MIYLVDAVDWQVGQQLVIAPSGYDFYEDEMRTITAVIDAHTLQLDRALEHDHFGEFGNEQGIMVDYRAEVGLLTRNIRIQGDESSDKSWFGVHMMVCFGVLFCMLIIP